MGLVVLSFRSEEAAAGQLVMALLGLCFRSTAVTLGCGQGRLVRTVTSWEAGPPALLTSLHFKDVTGSKGEQAHSSPRVLKPAPEKEGCGYAERPPALSMWPPTRRTPPSYLSMEFSYRIFSPL